MAASLDPLRYGLRALDEMAREQASVAPPPPQLSLEFSPRLVLRPTARDGAAFSLRLFTDAEDDATDLVLGKSSSRRFAPIPARAAPLFEAHAAALAMGGGDALTVGLPLATFLQQGSTRAAPLISRGDLQARWTTGDASWKVPPGAREGSALTLPDGLVLGLGDEPYALHAGIWFHLFGLDGAALGLIAAAGRAGLAALVRAATRMLESGGDDAGETTGDGDNDAAADAPLTREDLDAFAAAAMRRAPASRGLRCHPHGLAMLPPRGDPTSGLRTDLRAILEEAVPRHGPLAVFLGARATASPRGDVLSSGKLPPTASQLEAARAFEGARDLVAVCGPPGCGKTALLHHVAAQTVVSCALGTLWSTPPSRSAAWQLVVTSTNNAAVDHALSPFVSGAALPVGLRLGNRRTLAESTAAALTSAMEALGVPGAMSLPEARAAFESRASNVRAFQRSQAEARRAQATLAERRLMLERRAEALRDELARVPEGPGESMELSVLEAAEQALREHAVAASKLAPIHLDGPNASVERACEKWARANTLRRPRVEAVLSAVGIAMPFGDLDATCPRDDIGRQLAAMESALATLLNKRAEIMAPQRRSELAEITLELGSVPVEPSAPAVDPGLYDAALAVRDAWARAHRGTLVPLLSAARDAAAADVAPRGKPLQVALRELASLFPVAGCTLLSMRTSFPLERDVIDRLVIDEAAQCAPVYAAPALARARRAMFTGDTAQLPPVYTLDPRVDSRLARDLAEAAIAPFRMSSESITSAQAVAESSARSRLSLVEHFRSQLPIVELASRWSGYALDVRTPPRSLTHVSPTLHAAVIALPVRGIGARAALGVTNLAEASVAVDLAARLVSDGVAESDIAMLTPFVGQSVHIERELGARGLLAPGGILVSTVHRLQGGERRVVIFSLTATERRHLRWLAERPHLLHVATSRAQDHLVVLFDPEAVTQEANLEPLRALTRSV
jgi:hypothetical protein